MADYEYVGRCIEKPLTEWPIPPKRSSELKAKDLLTEVVHQVIPTFRTVVERSGFVRMLGVKFAIELHRKTHGGKLPKSLAELNIGEMAIDPVTGKLFQYAPGTGGKYTLVEAKAESVLPK